MITKLLAWFSVGLVIGFVYSFPDATQAPGPNDRNAAGEGLPIITSNMYPNARRDEKVQDTYANRTVVKDPYRWLEDPESDETKKFIEAEMAITVPYLERNPYRADIKTRLKELNNFPKYVGLIPQGDKFFFYQNTGLQNQLVLYVQDSLNSEPKVFIDPNTLSKDGTIAIDIDVSAFSDDGLIFAYALASNGSDWITIQFKHVEKGDIYKEKLTKVKFTTIAWTRNNKGIFYSAFLDHKGNLDGSGNDAYTNQKIYYHVLGTNQSEDVMVAEFPDNPNYMINTYSSDCGKYLVVTAAEGSFKNLVFIADLEKIKYEIKNKLDLAPIITKMDDSYRYLTNDEKTFFFLTNKDADNYKIIAIDIDNPDSKLWRTLVPEDPNNVLLWAEPAYNYLVLCYTVHVKSVLQIHDIKSGKMIKKFDLQPNNVINFACERKYKDLYFQVDGYLTPGIVYHVNLSTPTFDLEVFKELKEGKFDREKFIVEQVFYNSKDGTKIPMYIIYKKGLEKNGKNPAFLEGYGGYGSSVLPSFDSTFILFADNFDGVAAMANIRGGGEYGEKWHKAGYRDKKQNSFDDFQAAAEFLIENKYTNNKLLTIIGGSNGGLLVSACLNQRPDLYGAVVVDAGPADMLRQQKFTVGHYSVAEFGSSDNEQDLQYLYKYSPLHNIKIPESSDKQYPNTLLTTSDHDDRVAPFHSLKFIAALQFEAKNHPNQKNPFLIRMETKAGHGQYESTTKVIEKITDVMCFISNALGIKFHL